MGKLAVRFTHSLVEGVQIALSALLSNKTRSLLTTLGIIIGVVTVSLMMMIIQGLNRSFAKQIGFLGSRTVYVERHPWIWDDDWWRYINRPRLTMEHYEAILKHSRLAEAVAPQLWTRRPMTFRDNSLEGVGVLGTNYEMTIAGNFVPEFGRFLSDTDVRSGRRVCVIGKDIQKELFGTFSPIGRYLRIGAHNYRVVGILEEKGSTFGQSLDNFVMIPITTFIGTYGRHRSVEIAVKAKDGVQLEDLIDELTGIMRRARNLRPKDDNNFSINQQSALESFYKTMTAGIYGAGLVIGGISLLVGGIGIMNIMLVSVTERTWEIGMRKAVGAKTGHIMWQFLVEAMIICMVGGVLGVGLAALASLAIKTQLPTSLPTWLAFAAVIFSAVVGLIFGLFPAAKAARLDPIVALRQE
ncbi:MAG TPA: FtsX-like permease family protein [Bacteroidetes bacterium]|nr:FtsX-like permease family protein [Bacteroidota bacterium]